MALTEEEKEPVLSVRKALQPAAESKESEAQVEAEGDASKGRHRSEMASKPRRPQPGGECDIASEPRSLKQAGVSTNEERAK